MATGAMGPPWEKGLDLHSLIYQTLLEVNFLGHLFWFDHAGREVFVVVCILDRVA